MSVRYVKLELVIPDTATETPAVHIKGSLPVGLYVPAGSDWASMAPHGSVDGTNFAPLFDEAGNALTISLAASARQIALDPPQYAGVEYIKFVGDGAQSPSITLTLTLRSD